MSNLISLRTNWLFIFFVVDNTAQSYLDCKKGHMRKHSLLMLKSTVDYFGKKIHFFRKKKIFYPLQPKIISVNDFESMSASSELMNPKIMLYPHKYKTISSGE